MACDPADPPNPKLPLHIYYTWQGRVQQNCTYLYFSEPLFSFCSFPPEFQQQQLQKIEIVHKFNNPEILNSTLMLE